MKTKQSFSEAAYDRLKTAITGIPQKKRSDIYALSFWYYNDNDDPRFPRITVSYNTNAQFNNEQEGASSAEEARWNYAYWLEEEVVEVGGEEDELLSEWFKESPDYYTAEQDKAAQKDDALFQQLLEQGGRFDQEFIEVIIGLTQKLFAEEVISGAFGRNIPVIIHDLEYYEEPVDWTVRANPAGVVDEFLAAYEGGKL